MKRNEIIVAIAMIALGLMAPWVLPSVWTTVLSIFCYYAILTIGWNIIFGYTGLFSYGHVAFPAIGGYTSALLAEHLGHEDLLVDGQLAELVGDRLTPVFQAALQRDVAGNVIAHSGLCSVPSSFVAEDDGLPSVCWVHPSLKHSERLDPSRHADTFWRSRQKYP